MVTRNEQEYYKDIKRIANSLEDIVKKLKTLLDKNSYGN